MVVAYATDFMKIMNSEFSFGFFFGGGGYTLNGFQRRNGLYIINYAYTQIISQSNIFHGYIQALAILTQSLEKQFAHTDFRHASFSNLSHIAFVA